PGHIATDAHEPERTQAARQAQHHGGIYESDEHVHYPALFAQLFAKATLYARLEVHVGRASRDGVVIAPPRADPGRRRLVYLGARPRYRDAMTGGETGSFRIDDF